MNAFRLSKDARPSRYELRFDLDLDGWRFGGSGRVEIELRRPAREIVLHAVDLDVASALLDREPAVSVSYDDDAQTVTLEFASEAAAGQHVLELGWSGEIQPALRGLYRSVRGEERYATTQFEAADARRAFPCFDEPEFKARYRIELVHPAGLAAISNGAVGSTEDLGDGRRVTRFVELPKISSYLVAFAVGPFEATPEARTRSGVPVRVWVPPGLSDQGAFARDAHVRSVEWLEEYTGIPYPYGKVDAIGLPDFEQGAMENPGAITYRVLYLAADRRTASTSVLKAVFSVVAHELTHMWWGDLVTMAWWNDLWLNESFASFVGEKATVALNPEWDHERDMVRDAAGAFTLDALNATHPVSIEARTVEEAEQRFDAISYSKGQAVLRMIDGYLGERTFRDGVRIYLDRHREANATAADFWRALDEASGQDVSGLANAWIRDPGHPVVRCETVEADGGIQLKLRQERFYSDPELPPGDQLWPIPLVVAHGSAAGRREERVLLTERERTLRLPGATWCFPNGGASGFYRYAFDDPSIRLLGPAVPELLPTERLDLLGDTFALVRAGKASTLQLVDLVAALGPEDDRAVLQTLAEILGWIGHHALPDDATPAFRRFVSSIYAPQLERLGWDVREDDSFDERQKRVTVLAMLGQHAADPAVRAEARRRIGRHLSGESRLDPDLTSALAGVAAAEGDPALFDRYLARMRESEKTDAQEELRFRNALAQFQDPAIVDRCVELAFSDAIRDQDRTLMLPQMLGLRHARDAAWRAVRARWDERLSRMDPGGKHRMVEGIGQLTPRSLATEAIAFLEAHRTDDISEVAGQSIERLRLNVASAERIASELPSALGRVRQRAPAV